MCSVDTKCSHGRVGVMILVSMGNHWEIILCKMWLIIDVLILALVCSMGKYFGCSIGN